MKTSIITIRFICATLVALISSLAVTAQVGSLGPVVIGSTGNFSSSSTMSLSSTTGECIVTTAAAPTLTLTQGFQQPSSDVLASGDASCGMVVYKGLTPNGDGHNDTWVIDFIDLHPVNTIEIYNRWGALVWKGENYDNKTVVWNGNDLTDTKLPDGTYYFILKTSDCSTKGWVELSR